MHAQRRRLLTGALVALGVLLGLLAGPLGTPGSLARGVAAVGMLVLLAAPRVPGATARALYALLAGLALAATQGFGVGHQGTSEHPRDFAHYVLGARYFDELGYTRLYSCIVAAAEQHGLETSGWLVRDLETRRPMEPEVLRAAITACPTRFTPERWAQFSADLWTLQERSGGRMLPGLLQDHGFNPPPTWLVLAGPVARLGGTWHGLTWFDTLFVVLAAAATWRTFGLRVTALFLLVVGCLSPNQYAWVGGSFFRLDWLAALAVGFAALRLRRDGLAGAAFAFSSLVRLFPAVVAVAVLVSLLREGGARWRRFATGAAGLSAALVAAAVLLHGWASFPAAAANLATHAGAAALNSIGWDQVVLAPGEARWRRIPEQDAVPLLAEWEQRRAQAAHARAPVLLLGVSAACVGWWLATRRRAARAWTSVGLVPFLVPGLTCYYGAVLAFLSLGARTDRLLALNLGAVVLTSTLVPSTLALDDFFAVQSLLDVEAVSLALVLTAVRRR